jgi:cardiolipin synthase A/B
MKRFQSTLVIVLALLLGGCAAMGHDAPPVQGLETPLLSGNKVTLLFDGPKTMAAMEAAILGAKSTIHLETYVFDQDPIGLRFADLLMQRQRSGVKVRIIYDAVGTLGTPDVFFDRLRDAGIELLAFNPVNPFKLRGPWLPNNRDHRKILVVDGQIGFTGGVNISESYSNSSLFRSRHKEESEIGWRDTHLQIQGPAVAALQTVFLQTWNARAEHAVGGPDLFPPLPFAGKKGVRVLASEPHGQMEIYDAYLDAIHTAKHRIYLTCAYFVPDATMLDALMEAAQRGVDVKVILPGVQEGGMVFYAGHAFFEQMLRGGMHLYQLRQAVLHAKTAVIDGRWSTVGSSNFDTRSFVHNSEINVIVIDDAFGRDMESAFAEDLRDSQEVQLQVWLQRPLSERLKEWAAKQFDYWL